MPATDELLKEEELSVREGFKLVPLGVPAGLIFAFLGFLSEVIPWILVYGLDFGQRKADRHFLVQPGADPELVRGGSFVD